MSINRYVEGSVRSDVAIACQFFDKRHQNLNVDTIGRAYRGSGVRAERALRHFYLEYPSIRVLPC